MEYIHETNAIFDDVTNFIGSMIERNPAVHHLGMIEQTYNGMVEKRWILVYSDEATVHEFIRLCQLSNSTNYCTMHTLHASKLLLPWDDRGALVTWLSAHRPHALPWQHVDSVDDMVSYFTDVTIVIMPYGPMDIDESLYMEFDIHYEEVRSLVSKTYYDAGLRHRLAQEGNLLDGYLDKFFVFDALSQRFLTAPG